MYKDGLIEPHTGVPRKFPAQRDYLYEKIYGRRSDCIVTLFTFDYQGELKAPNRKLHGSTKRRNRKLYARHTNQEATCKFQRPGDIHKETVSAAALFIHCCRIFNKQYKRNWPLKIVIQTPRKKYCTLNRLA